MGTFSPLGYPGFGAYGGGGSAPGGGAAILTCGKTIQIKSYRKAQLKVTLLKTV